MLKLIAQQKKWLLKVALPLGTFLLSLGVVHSAVGFSLSQTPLFIGQNAKPVIMLAMSRDESLYFAAYGDYSNLDGGALSSRDLTYRNDFTYAGYFDSSWCYGYSSNNTASLSQFVPVAQATNHKCNTVTNGRWSGNFLNWASMTRMDILRKVLYGGKRSIDTANGNGQTLANTVLERAYIPKDSHAFVKVFASNATNALVSEVTPYTQSTVSLCSVSTADPGNSGYPVIRVANGDWSQWSHSEVQQCQWRNGTNGFGRTTAPRITTDKLDELTAKVQVCQPELDGETNTYVDSDEATKNNRCRSYESGSFKPIGLLQKFYDKVKFGLVTGSWAKPDKGGVLRKAASQLAGNTYSGNNDTVNEFNINTGVFNLANVPTGVIKTIDALYIKNFTFTPSNGNISYSADSDWRNPIGEIYAETLRYLVGNTDPTSDFNGSDSWLTKESNAWSDPVPTGNWCSKCSVIVISSGPNSFDGDGITDSVLGSVKSLTTRAQIDTVSDSIGLQEFGATTNNVYHGGTSVATQCTAVAEKLSQMLGQCPEFPMSKGTYAIAGLAYWAHITDLRPTVNSQSGSYYTGNQVISTYGVELSEGLPSFEIPLPNGKKASFVPVCRNGTTSACSLVGVRVENIVNDANGYPISGSYLFYWEDQQWASDYDLDAVQRLRFCVGTACGANSPSELIRFTNTLPYWATGTGSMFMSYILSGVGSDDGLQASQWIHRTGYEYVPEFTTNTTMGNQTWYNTILPQGTDALPGTTTTAIYSISKDFTVSGTNVVQVKSPIYYAAKYGSFANESVNSNADNKPNDPSEWDTKTLLGATGADGIPDNYFMMKNPSLLEARLFDILKNASDDTASGSGVATNSTQYNENNTRIFQARFFTRDWSGQLRALKKATASATDFTPVWDTDGKIPAESSRKIFTYKPGSAGSVGNGKDFVTSGFNSRYTSAQQTALGGSSAGPNVINWVRGTNVTGYRSRTQDSLLGDIVNSTPVYQGNTGRGFEGLPAVYGSASYLQFVSQTKGANSYKTAIYVGANDGQMHAFDAETGAELFAYVPSIVFSKLPTIADAAYGKTIPHTYTVDGQIAVSDAYVGGDWQTVLVGAAGAGARGVFVLDVSSPQNFSESKVMFEISSADYPDIGNVMGKPIIAPVAGRWKVIFGNGYNSGSGIAKLFVIDLEAPFDSNYSRVISTGAGGDNGLSSPVGIQNATSGAVDTIYAGDLNGNMWKFDLSSSNASNWSVAFSTSSSSPAPLFIAKDSSGNTQPIFGAPTLGSNQHIPGSKMIYFGTGKYIEQADIEATQMSRVQSLYGILDESYKVSYSSARTEKLHEKHMSSANGNRYIDDADPNPIHVAWVISSSASSAASSASSASSSSGPHNGKSGWYLDLPAGERVISRPVLANDRVLYSTMVPSTDLCTFGGSGWVLELVGVGPNSSSASSSSSSSSTSSTGSSSSTASTGSTSSTGSTGSSGASSSSSSTESYQLLPTEGEGIKLDFYLPGDMVKIQDVLVLSDITGDVKAQNLNASSSSTAGTQRVSWRQIR